MKEKKHLVAFKQIKQGLKSFRPCSRGGGNNGVVVLCTAISIFAQYHSEWGATGELKFVWMFQPGRMPSQSDFLFVTENRIQLFFWLSPSACHRRRHQILLLQLETVLNDIWLGWYFSTKFNSLVASNSDWYCANIDNGEIRATLQERQPREQQRNQLELDTIFMVRFGREVRLLYVAGKKLWCRATASSEKRPTPIHPTTCASHNNRK